MDPLGNSQFRSEALRAGYTAKEIDDYLNKKAQAALVQTGDIPFTDYAKSDPQGAYSLRSGGYEPQVQLDATGRKRQAALSAAIPVLARMTESALKAPPGIAGSLLASAGNIPGVEGGEA